MNRPAISIGKRWDVVLTLVFFAVLLALMLRHEMWRDEMHHWKIVTDSPSPAAILKTVKYEGHPFLWHALLFPFSRVSSSPLMMQAVHLLVAVLAAFLFLRHAPFSRLQKGLFIFGYFPLYEYGVISRNYALGFLFLILFCRLYPQRFRRFPLMALFLALSANTSVYALILAVALATGMLAEFLKEKAAFDAKKFALGTAILLAGIAVAVWVMVPPSDSGNVTDWTWRWDGSLLEKVAATPFLAFFPLPAPGLHFWNSNFLAEAGVPPAALAILSAFIVLFGVLLVGRKRDVLLVYLIGTFGLLGFFYVKYYGYLRHHGFLYLLLIICAWLYLRPPASPRAERPPSAAPPRFPRVLNGVLTGLLVVQVLAGAAAGGTDAVRTFSQGKVAARFIKSHGLDRLPIVGDIDFSCTTVSGYLNKKIYFPRGRRWGSFVIWDTIRTRLITEEAVLETARQISVKTGKSCVIVLNTPLSEPWLEFTKVRKIGETRPAVVKDESYFLYLLPYSRSLSESLNRQLIPFLRIPR